jgi:hypothetical protein
MAGSSRLRIATFSRRIVGATGNGGRRVSTAV